MSNLSSTETQRTETSVSEAASGATARYRVGDPAPPPLKPFTESELIEMWGGETDPVVSILCPTYNHREFIADALDGFLGQATDFPFEVIVRDDKTGEEISRARYTFNATKSPHWITVEVDDSPNEDSGDRRLGIFRIQDVELNLKQEIADGGERPTTFDGRFSRFKRIPTNNKAEQAGTGQPATRPESKSEGGDKPQSESEGCPR
jgi:hypothetical protein